MRKKKIQMSANLESIAWASPAPQEHLCEKRTGVTACSTCTEPYHGALPSLSMHSTSIKSTVPWQVTEMAMSIINLDKEVRMTFLSILSATSTLILEQIPDWGNSGQQKTRLSPLLFNLMCHWRRYLRQQSRAKALFANHLLIALWAECGRVSVIVASKPLWAQGLLRDSWI